MVKCSKTLWEYSVGEKLYSKVSTGRGSASIPCVEGFFMPGGVMYGHVSLITAESPADVMNGLEH